MYIGLYTLQEITKAEIKDGVLNIFLGDNGNMCIRREDIEKNPSKFITIASYINNTIQDIEKEI